MKKLLLLVILAAGGWFGGKRFMEKRAAAAAERMEAADIKEGMNVGDLRKALGDPRSTSDGLSWAGGIVTAKVGATDELAEPTEIKFLAAYPGLIRGRPIEDFSRMAGLVRGKATWIEVGTASGDEKWFVVWENDGTPERGVVSVALARARQP